MYFVSSISDKVHRLLTRHEAADQQEDEGVEQSADKGGDGVPVEQGRD